MKFKKFGWNGFLLGVPEEMRFTRQGGDAKEGDFLLEAEDYLAEVKWQPIARRRKPLAAAADTVVEKIGKEYKKKKQDVNVLAKDATSVNEHNAVYMLVKSAVDERYYIWYCTESSRLVILRFIFKSFDETAKSIVKRILDTARCHMDGSNIWSLMNVRFEAPESFILTEAKIAVGRARFVLTETRLSTFAEKTATILVEYFSMANVVYKETYEDPDKWFEENYLKDISNQFKKRKIKFETVGPRDLRRHRLVVKQAKTVSGVSWRSTTIYSNATWYCPKANRIYSVTVASGTTRPMLFKREVDVGMHAQLFGNFLPSIECH